jgi:hypothetical protein
MPLLMTPPTERLTLGDEWYDLKTKLSFADMRLAQEYRSKFRVYYQAQMQNTPETVVQNWERQRQAFNVSLDLIALFLVGWCHPEALTRQAIDYLDQQTVMALFDHAVRLLLENEGVSSNLPLAKPLPESSGN